MVWFSGNESWEVSDRACEYGRAVFCGGRFLGQMGAGTVSRAQVVDDESGRLRETKPLRMIARQASGRATDGVRHVRIDGSDARKRLARYF